MKLDCITLNIARELVGKLESYPLPDDWEPGDEPYDVILAEIRHNYTNYEELLYDLPDCNPDCSYFGERCACPNFQGNWETGEECLGRIQAHDLLKWAAKGLAEKMLQERNQRDL